MVYIQYSSYHLSIRTVDDKSRWRRLSRKLKFIIVAFVHKGRFDLKNPTAVKTNFSTVVFVLAIEPLRMLMIRLAKRLCLEVYVVPGGVRSSFKVVKKRSIVLSNETKCSSYVERVESFERPKHVYKN